MAVDGTAALDEDVRAWRRLVMRVRDTETERPSGFENTAIAMEAFEAVLPSIVPSSKREGFATVPDTTWEDIGALEEVRHALQMAIVQPIRDPERFARFGITEAAGVLLWGPPGCGKTLLAKAVAAESKANFISIKGPELLNKVSLFKFLHPSCSMAAFEVLNATGSTNMMIDESNVMCGLLTLHYTVRRRI